MLISLQLASGNTAIDINDIWKVQETDTGCKVSAGTDVYSSSTPYADVLAAGASKLFEVALTGGDTVALNIDHVKTVYENPAGGVSIVLNNGKVLTSSTTFAAFVAAQYSLAGSEREITGTITGLDAALVPIFPMPDTKPYFLTAEVLVKCTAAGEGTVVEGDARILGAFLIAVNNEGGEIVESSRYNDSSMEEAAIGIEDISDGQLRLSITPPFDTGAADSEYSYKIRVSGFGL